jgi:hypothetical protein
MDEYAILADVLREVRANNNRDSSMDDKDLQSRTSEETCRAQRTGTIDSDDKKLFQYQASADDKISAPSDTGSDQKGQDGKLGSADNRERKQQQSDPY